MRGLLVGLMLGALGLGAGFVAGRSSVPTAGAAASPVALPPLTVALQNDPRELIPLVPGPGEGPGQTPQPGQEPGAPQAGPQAPGEGECTVLLHRDGQFYRLQPGQPGPGQPQPGRGERGEGQPGGSDDELFPLEPFQAPPGPGVPDQPGAPGLDLRV